MVVGQLWLLKSRILALEERIDGKTANMLK
jgi:hypothetical protein